MFSYTDQELILLIKEGNKKAFEYFYKVYNARLITLVLFLTNSEEIAEDIVQDAFTRLWERRESLDVNQSLKAFIRQITRNLVYDHYRKAKVIRSYNGQVLTDECSNETIDHINYRELEQVLSKAIEHLSPEKQLMFRQSRFEHKTYAEIAESMQTTPKAVERHMAKSISFIKNYVFKYSGEIIILFPFILPVTL